MTGWRAGWIAGNAEVVERYRHLKTNLDSGCSRPSRRRRSRRSRRRATSHARCPRSTSAGATSSPTRCGRSASTSLLRARRRTSGRACPKGYTSASFAELVLEQANVVVSPGNAYGPSGEGYVRLSLTVPDERLRGSGLPLQASLVILQP